MAKDLKPLKPSEKQLEELAEITPEDIEAAKLTWEEVAPPKYRTLLDAEPVDPDLEDLP